VRAGDPVRELIESSRPDSFRQGARASTSWERLCVSISVKSISVFHPAPHPLCELTRDSLPKTPV
jgi:hypothetical protein